MQKTRLSAWNFIAADAAEDEKTATPQKKNAACFQAAFVNQYLS